MRKGHASWIWDAIKALAAVGGVISLIIYVLSFYDLRKENDTLQSDLNTLKVELQTAKESMLVAKSGLIAKQDVVEKRFEWQWAGENWFGSIKFGKENQDGSIGIEKTTMHILKKQQHSINNIDIMGIAFENDPAKQSKATIVDAGNSLFVVLHILKGSARSPQTIEGKLGRRVAFGGEIAYKSYSRATPTYGRITLSDYESAINFSEKTLKFVDGPWPASIR